MRSSAQPSRPQTASSRSSPTGTAASWRSTSNPANPVLEGHTVYQADEDGDGHSSMYDDARQLLFSADEDFGKNCGPDIEPGYGYLRIWDYSTWPRRCRSASTGRRTRRAAPARLGRLHDPQPDADGHRRVHLVVLGRRARRRRERPDGPRGSRVLRASGGTEPVKPSQRSTSQTPQVWGVFVDEETGLVYASDMNTGLWILRRTD